MIIGQFHQGSGLGNQLHRYVATRIKAKELGVDFAMTNTDLFKGRDFMRLEMGVPIKEQEYKYFQEKKVTENGIDIRGYDPEFNFIEDNTVIEGEFQDERYWRGYRLNIKEWLDVDVLEMPWDLCIIGFRGGEYTLFPDLFLTQDYWDKAISFMREKYPKIRFEVHTDDVETAQKFFPDFKCINDIGLNWRSVRFARHLIIANSSFFIFPAVFGEAVEVIAPRGWSRHNIGVWAMPQNYYSNLTYI